MNTRYNSVFVAPTHTLNDAAHVYRDGTDKQPQAANLSSALYTAASVQRAAGIAVLRESGTHKLETVTLAPPSEKVCDWSSEIGGDLAI